MAVKSPKRSEDKYAMKGPWVIWLLRRADSHSELTVKIIFWFYHQIGTEAHITVLQCYHWFPKKYGQILRPHLNQPLSYKHKRAAVQSVCHPSLQVQAQKESSGCALWLLPCSLQAWYAMCFMVAFVIVIFVHCGRCCCSSYHYSCSRSCSSCSSSFFSFFFLFFLLSSSFFFFLRFLSSFFLLLHLLPSCYSCCSSCSSSCFFCSCSSPIMFIIITIIIIIIIIIVTLLLLS